jgi:transposase-like protein
MADSSMSHTQPLKSVYVKEQQSRIVTQSHPESVRQQIIERYLAGDKVALIEAATGVSRPTIYTYVKDAGYTPARATKTKPVHTRDVMEQLAEANQEIGRLQAKLEVALEQLERLKKIDTDTS